MSFLWYIHDRRSRKHKSLICRTFPGLQSPDQCAGEKISGASCHSASLTVEAAAAMPLFLLTMFLFWNLFTACLIHIRIQHGLDEVSAQLAQQSYAMEALSSASGRGDTADGGITLPKAVMGAAWRAGAQAMVVQAAGAEALNASPVKNGASGLDLALSTWNRHKDIKLVCCYRLSLRIPLGSLFDIRVKQVSRRKCWTGKQPASGGQDGEEETQAAVEYVYVTETGTVFHRDINCYHLNVTVRKVSASSIGAQRNRGGGKYKPCQHCAAGVAVPGTLYITPEGDRYHVTRDCSGLKRTVKTVPLSQVSFRPCKHCGDKS